MSLSTISASFTAVTVKVMLAGSHNTGISAHTVYGNVATPLKFSAGSMSQPVVVSYVQTPSGSSNCILNSRCWV
jgi:hypothetical protein